MEQSVVRKEWGRLRLLPIVFAVVGLVCASWLSISTDKTLQKDSQGDAGPESAAPDTLVLKNTEPSILYNYRSESRENEGIEDDGIAQSSDDFNAPPVTQFYVPDSIPGFYYGSHEDWEKFEEEFTKKFRQEFGEFFSKNREQYEKMMEDLRKQHADNVFEMRGMDVLSPEQLEALEELALINPAIPNFENIPMPEFPVLNEEWLTGEQIRMLEEEARHMNDLLRQEEFFLRGEKELLNLKDLFLLDNAGTFREYEQEIVKQLTKDGYLKEGENVGELQIRNEEITVNGKKVKEKDLKKYQEIRAKYEHRWARPGRVE